MAKAAMAVVEEPKIAGRGQKTCPACGQIVGARSAECKFCHHTFEVKEKAAGGSRKAAGSVNGMAAIKHALEFIKAAGGIVEAKSQIQEMADFFAKVGGPAQAVAAIEQIEEIQALTTKKGAK